MRDFLHRAEPGDVFADGHPWQLLRDDRFRQRQTSQDTSSCRPGAAGGIVETISTAHEGRPAYAYRSVAFASAIFADETCRKR